MTTAEAYVTAIECLREFGGDGKATRHALKVLEAKYQKLRLRAETLAAGKAADLTIFELAYTELSTARICAIRDFYNGRVCENCQQGKAEHVGFCVTRCWPRIHAKIRHAMHALKMGEGWEGAYQRGLEWLRLNNPLPAAEIGARLEFLKKCQIS